MNKNDAAMLLFNEVNRRPSISINRNTAIQNDEYKNVFGSGSVPTRLSPSHCNNASFPNDNRIEMQTANTRAYIRKLTVETTFNFKKDNPINIITTMENAE